MPQRAGVQTSRLVPCVRFGMEGGDVGVRFGESEHRHQVRRSSSPGGIVVWLRRHAATTRRQGHRSDAVPAINEGNPSKGPKPSLGRRRRARLLSGAGGIGSARNAMNPKVGCGVQQTRGRRAEKAAEVVRNHEGGTRCWWVEPSARRFGACTAPGVDARLVYGAGAPKRARPREEEPRPERSGRGGAPAELRAL